MSHWGQVPIGHSKNSNSTNFELFTLTISIILILCSNQSQVTRAFIEMADVTVFFKGGSGTLAELFHAIWITEVIFCGR